METTAIAALRVSGRRWREVALSLQAEVAGIGDEAPVERDGGKFVPVAGLETGLVQLDDLCARGRREDRRVGSHQHLDTVITELGQLVGHLDLGRE